MSLRAPGRGRFAPSPTGPLHFGSAVAAAASWLDARSRGDEWLVRIEDLDTPRNRPGAEAAILRSLERLGLPWDGPVLRQSTRLEAYREALEGLRRDGHTFPCGCTRAEIGRRPYPGTCRRGLPPGRRARSLRVRVDATPIRFVDAIQGPQCLELEAVSGDFPVQRADGIVAYHLAVVVDDAWQGITEVVRGSDLLDSTPRHLHLQRLLGLPSPGYAHLPVAVNRDGQKLSKQTHAPSLDDQRPVAVALATLEFLGHPVHPALAEAVEPETVWRWAAARWQRSRVPRAPRRVAPKGPDEVTRAPAPEPA